MKLLAPTLACSLVIAVGAWGRIAASPVVVTHSVRVSHPSPYRQCSSPPGAQVGAAVEPQIAAGPTVAGASPSTLIGVWQQDRFSSGGSRGLAVASSFDGGRSWSETSLPFTTCTHSGLRFQVASDPWIAIGPDGTAYASALVGNPSAQEWGVAAATSTNGGRSWHHAQTIIRDGCCSVSDKESVTADPDKPGVAYMIWNRGDDFGSPAWFARTANRGRTWSRPRPVLHGRGLVTTANQIVVDPRTDTLYDIFSLAHQSVADQRCPGSHAQHGCPKSPREVGEVSLAWSIAVIRSKDGGATWSAPTTVARDLAVGVPAYTRRIRTGTDVPSAAIDRSSGAIAVVWQDARFTHGAYDEIVLARSIDGGAHWTGPVRVSPDTGWPAFTPAVAVSAQGVIGVSFFRLHSFRLSDPALPTDYWFTWSVDGGRHFGGTVHLAGPFDLLAAPRSNGPFLGDYEGLTAVEDTFVPFFAQTHSGRPANRADIFATAINPVC